MPHFCVGPAWPLWLPGLWSLHSAMLLPGTVPPAPRNLGMEEARLSLVLTPSRYQQLHLPRGSRTCQFVPHSWAPSWTCPSSPPAWTIKQAHPGLWLPTPTVCSQEGVRPGPLLPRAPLWLRLTQGKSEGPPMAHRDPHALPCHLSASAPSPLLTLSLQP